MSQYQSKEPQINVKATRENVKQRQEAKQKKTCAPGVH